MSLEGSSDYILYKFVWNIPCIADDKSNLVGPYNAEFKLCSNLFISEVDLESSI